MSFKHKLSVNPTACCVFIIFTLLLVPGVLWASGVQTETQKLLASDGDWYDEFGDSVSLSGEYALIGARFDEENGGSSGSAYIYHHDGTAWVQQAKLLASDGAASDQFGTSVSLFGDYALVGAHGDADKGTYTGSAYIFHYDGTAWVQQAKLLANDGATQAGFGSSVSLSGDYALVGAAGGVDDNGVYVGSAYIFHYDGTEWTQQQKLVASDGISQDYFGNSVSLSGSYALIGAKGDDDNGSSSGSAYIFHCDGTAWVQQEKLLASDGAAGDMFGWSVSLSGNYALVGANNSIFDGNGVHVGSAYLFHYDGTNWVEQHQFVASDRGSGDHFGDSVSLYGDYVLVGADDWDSDNGASSGSAYLFHYDGASWVEQQLQASDGAEFNYLACSVSLSGDYALAGALGNDGNGESSGAAYIYNLTENDSTAPIVTGTYLVTQYDEGGYSALSSLEFNGSGSVLWTELYNSDPSLHAPETLNYAVNPDGSMTISVTGFTLRGAVINDGSTFSLIDDVDPGLFVGIKKSASMTNTDLTGTYLVTQYDEGGYTALSSLEFDGAGSVVWTELANSDPSLHAPETLNYTVNLDGSMTILVTGFTLRGVVSGAGSTFSLTDTVDSGLFVGIKKSASMGNAALTGTYLVSQYDEGGYSALSSLEFDGAGSVVWTELYNTDSSLHAPEILNYTVNPDGSMSISVTGFILSGVVSSDGSTFSLIDDVDPGLFVGVKKSTVSSDSSTKNDLTGDGTADVLIRNNTFGVLFMIEMDSGTAAFESVSALDKTAWGVAGIGDLTGDGTADVLIRHTTFGALYVIEMDGGTSIISSVTGLDKATWDVEGVADLTGDGTDDILIRHTTAGVLYMVKMDSGTAVIAPVTALDKTTWSVEGMGDLTGDGTADILIRNNTFGVLFMIKMDSGTAVFASVSALDKTAWDVAGVGDLSGDGTADILIRHNTFGALYMINMDGATPAIASVTGLDKATWDVENVSDLTGDGKEDILIRHTTAGVLYMVKMDSGIAAIAPVTALDKATWNVMP